MTEPTLEQIMNRSIKWLFRVQDKESGGWGSRPDRGPSTLNTAEAIIGILDTNLVEPGHEGIQRAVKFLKAHWCHEGEHRGAWSRELKQQAGEVAKVPDVLRTSVIVKAMIKAGNSTKEEPVKDALDWLIQIRGQNEIGWGFQPHGRSMVISTCFVLMALIEAYAAQDKRLISTITDGINFLIDKRNFDGSFGEEDKFRAVSTIYTVLILQKARRFKLASFIEEEKRAIEWILENPSEARKIVEKKITIVGPGLEDWNNVSYGYMFVTQALLIRVIMGSTDKAHHNSQLIKDSLISLNDKMDEDGGFYGSHIYTWSTAKVLSALNSASSEFPNLPHRKPEIPGVRANSFIFGFAILLSIGVIILTLKDRFGVWQAFTFALLMLSCLLAQGLIGENSFKEIIKFNLGLLKNK